jgi:hypothetical protein
MSTLTITKSYVAGAILLEADLDHFRDGLLTLFNTTKFSSGNFNAAMSLTASLFSSVELTHSDSLTLTFGTDSDGTIGVNASKELVFNTATASTTLTMKAVTKTMVFKTTQLDAPGEIVLGSGASGYGVLHLLSRYRKPVLVYNSSSSLSIENNTGTTNETLISFPKYLIAVTEALSGGEKYRKISLSNTANGYSTSHTGAASGGMRVGLSATANTWYAVYAGRVRGGTNAGNKFVLVVDDTLPSQANYATLNTRYGDGEWVYLGLIRYGFGVVGSTTQLVPFLYSNKGWCYFTAGDPGVTTSGITLAQSVTNADDTPFYTLSNSMSGAAIPTDAITMAQWSFDRQDTSNWAIRDASDNVIWRGGWPDEGSGVHGHVVITAAESGMDFTQTRITTGAFDKRLSIAGFCDRYLNLRRHGHGI